MKSGYGRAEFGVLRKPTVGLLVVTNMLDDAMKEGLCSAGYCWQSLVILIIMLRRLAIVWMG